MKEIKATGSSVIVKIQKKKEETLESGLIISAEESEKDLGVQDATVISAGPGTPKKPMPNLGYGSMIIINKFSGLLIESTSEYDIKVVDCDDVKGIYC
jgi:co-chaperonin GroES (HSP10)